MRVELKALKKGLSEIGEADNLAALRGHEGMAARSYFATLGKMFQAPFQYTFNVLDFQGAKLVYPGPG